MPVRNLFWFLATLLLALWYRLPAIWNPAGLNSDATIVGLQGMHILRGEWAPYLWGAGYQSSFEATLAAISFAIFGVSPLSLLFVPLVGFFVLLTLVFFTLRRHLHPLWCFVLTLPLAFATPIANGVTLILPRMWCLTAVFLSVFLFDRRRFVGGALAIFLAIHLDFFALQFLPAVLLLGYLATEGGTYREWRSMPRRHFLVGCLTGFSLLVISRLLGPSAGGSASFSLGVVFRNLQLLFSTCLPIALGGKIYFSAGHLYPDLWIGPWPIRIVQFLAPLSYFVGIGAAIAVLYRKEGPPELRRLGLFGIATIGLTFLGFAGSKMVSDMHSSRYLSPMIWATPFALAPLAARWKLKYVLGLLIPFLFTTSLATRMSYGEAGRSLLGSRVPSGQGAEEMALAAFLREKQVHAAHAQYWLAYRLCFLFRENPIVIPSDPSSNRYAPYVEKAKLPGLYAQILHPSEPRETERYWEDVFLARQISFEKHRVGDFTVYLHRSPQRHGGG